MKRLVIKNGTVVDPASGLMEPRHVLCAEGHIQGVAREVPSDWRDAEVLDATGRWVLPGLVDLRTHVGEPGEEWKEDVDSALRSALAGGFTTIFATPDSNPVNDNRAITSQLVKHGARVPGRVMPVGAATVGLKGEQLAEMGDLSDAGCSAISTGEGPLPSARMLRRVLEYLKTVGSVLFTVAEDPSLASNAVIHEGAVSVRLGMKAVPAESEAIALYQIGTIAKLVGHRVHVQRLSTRMGLDVLRRLKDDGAPITADVTPHHLWFTDDRVATFDTSARVRPPLRSADDVQALRDAVASGLIDAIATDHRPQTSVEKALEFEYAQPGTTGLETALPAVFELVHRGVLTPLQAVARLTTGPANVAYASGAAIADGSAADLAIVDPLTPRRVEAARHHSKSRNCLFEGMSLTGVVEATVWAGRVVYPFPEPNDAW